MIHFISELKYYKAFVIVLAVMRKKIDTILIHTDAFLLGTLGEEFVQGFGHSQSDLTF